MKSRTRQNKNFTVRLKALLDKVKAGLMDIEQAEDYLFASKSRTGGADNSTQEGKNKKL